MRNSLWVFLMLGCQGLHIGSEQSPIIGGQTTTGDPAVVLLVAMSNQGEAYCTAEVVSPHVILTAAHCVDPATVGSGNTFQIFLGSDVNGSQGQQSSLYIDVKETHYNTSFDPNRLDGGHDVGVAILSTATTVTPIPMNRTALTQALVGQSLRLVGYGIDSGNDQQGTSAGTKRVVTTPLTDFDSLFIDFGTASKGTCEGDSGGPAFMTINGTEVITGITSFGPQGCNGGSTDTRVDTEAVPFINPYIQMFDPGFNTGGTTGAGGTTGSGGTTGLGGTTGSGTTAGNTGTNGGSNTGTTGSGTGTNGGSNTGTNGGGTGTNGGGNTGTNGGGNTGTNGGGNTGTNGGSNTGTNGGNTGTSGSGSCSATLPCPTNYTCVMSGGTGECILAPTPQSGSSTGDSNSGATGCSVGGGHDAPTPLVFMLFGFVFLRRFKRQET